MTIEARQDNTLAALRRALIARAAELSIYAETVSSPSPNAITARCQDGSLLRLDFGNWPDAELSR